MSSASQSKMKISLISPWRESEGGELESVTAAQIVYLLMFQAEEGGEDGGGGSLCRSDLPVYDRASQHRSLYT